MIQISVLISQNVVLLMLYFILLLLWSRLVSDLCCSVVSCNTKLFPVPVMDIRGRPGVGFPWFRPHNYSVPDTSREKLHSIVDSESWESGKQRSKEFTLIYLQHICLILTLICPKYKYVWFTTPLHRSCPWQWTWLKVEHRVIWEKFSSLSFITE